MKKRAIPNNTDTICSICRKEEDAKEHVVDCKVELEKGKHIV